MKKRTTADLLDEIMNLGFSQDEALEGIDTSLDPLYEDPSNRPSMKEEFLPEDLYNSILSGFQTEAQENEFFEEESKGKGVYKEVYLG